MNKQTKTAVKATANKEQATESTKKEFNLEQVFAMWKEYAKKGGAYFTGRYNGRFIKGFYNTDKKNLKEPDIRIYFIDDEKKLEKEPFLSLWCNATEKGKKYLSGKLDDKRVVGFINETADEKNRRPYFSIYWSEEEKPQMEEIEDNQLPF